VLKDLFDRGEMPEMGAEILWDAADDVPQEETAEELKLSVRQVEYRLHKMRDRFAQRLVVLGLRER
jgi:DNA-directed RNA polymerase specialized sigma24 family protein